MPPGKPRNAKQGRDSYVFNRSAPHIATLPRATKELIVAYRIFSPGLNDLTDLEQSAANVLRDLDNGMCEELMKNLGVSSTRAVREVCKKSYAAYASEIQRMNDEEGAEAARLAEELAAHEAEEQAQQESTKTTESSEKVKHEKRKAMEEGQTATRQEFAQKNNKNNSNSSNSNKRCADDDLAASSPSPSKRSRHDPTTDLIPDPYWLSQADAQATLDAMGRRTKALAATLTRLEDFYLDTFLPTGATPPIPTVSASLARADIQLRRDAVWYIDELQKVMAGAASPELGVVAALGSGAAWKRNRFGNPVVRGLIERIRELYARLVGAEREMGEADRLRGEFVGGDEGAREVFLEGWAAQLVRVTETLAYEAPQYVSFRTMEAEWRMKWAEEREEGGGEEEAERRSVIVIDGSDSDDGGRADGSQDDLEDDD